MDLLTVLLLALAAFAAAFVDSIVGGGGVITLPALLAAGLPPHLALGTNKLAATSASLTASLHYLRAGTVQRRVLWWFPLSVLGSLAGVALVLTVPGKTIVGLVVVAMAVMTTYVLLRPRFGAATAPAAPTVTRLALGAAVAAAVGFYDGFLGPGTGSFLLFGLVATQGWAFLPAAATGRVLNFGSNIAALVFFAAAGEVAWAVGLAMVPGMVLGARAGAMVGLRHGARWIRPLFLVMSVALMVRLVAGL